MMAVDLARSLDPVLLARDCGIEPDAWQAELLRARPKRALLCCSRQSGKTEVAIHLGLWTALYEPGSLVLIISPSQRQSGETFRRLLIAHGKLKDAPELTQESALRATLANDSRIVALPGSERTTRGYAAARMVIIDEGAQVPDGLLAAIRPTLGTVDGSLIALSTPYGQRGWFYEAWTEGGEDWTRVKVTADQCPRLSAEYLAGELKALGPSVFKQEFGCEFVANAENLFSVELINRAFTSELRSIW
jgi:Terminase large subunit, T4likevirus-type, N-terminal